MKNEKTLTKILKESIAGFPIGVTLLIFSYVSVYFISGKEIFNIELFQLHDINILISQVIFTGISGYILAIIFHFISDLIKFESILLKERPYKYSLTFSMCSFSIIMIMLSTLNTKIFSKNICTLNSIIILLTCVLFFISSAIKNMIDKILIKKINQKIQERNNL